MNEGIEHVHSGREILKNLESEGKYLFHGSPSGDIGILEPRQSTHVPDSTKYTQMINDGDPAVSATPYTDMAIFRAIVNSKNIQMSHNSSFGTKGDELLFSISSEEALNKVKDKNGFVYVFNKNDFQPYNRNGNADEKSFEWRTYKSIKPVMIVEVNFSDLPDIEKIKITNEKY